MRKMNIMNIICLIIKCVVKFEIDIHQTYDMIKKIIEEKIIETYEEEKIILNSMVSWD